MNMFFTTIKLDSMYKDFKHEQTAWLSDGCTIFDLTASEVNSLTAIADSSKGTTGVQARAILRFAYPSQYSYTDCIDYPGSSTKSAELKPLENDGINSTLKVTVQPNPAYSKATFSYVLPDGIETALLTLYSTTGKQLQTVLLTGGNSEYNYNCTPLKQGIYYYKVTAGNNSVSGKLVIVR